MKLRPTALSQGYHEHRWEARMPPPPESMLVWVGGRYVLCAADIPTLIRGRGEIGIVTSRGRRALLRRRPEDDEGTQLGREWNRTFIECETRGYIGVVDSRIRHIRRLPDLAVAQCRNDPKPRGSARHESAQLRNTTIDTKRQTRFRNSIVPTLLTMIVWVIIGVVGQQLPKKSAFYRTAELRDCHLITISVPYRLWI